MKKSGTNIFLTGGRATGKTTIGKLVAKKLHMDFLDMDTVLEDQDGRTIQEMVKTNGWDYFREREKQLLQNLTKKNNQVIATGGGAILHQQIWPAIKKKGFVVWLTAEPETLKARLKQDPKTGSQRPSISGKDVVSEAEKIMAERKPLYRKSCHIQIDTDQQAEKIASCIIDEYENKVA